jgi:hypothetical protein
MELDSQVFGDVTMYSVMCANFDTTVYRCM